MDILGKILLIGLIGAVLSLMLKKESPVFALIISLATGIIIFYFISDLLIYTLSSVKALMLKSQIDVEAVNSVFKICAIGIVSEYFCSVIKDAGEEGLSKKVELGAKVLIFAQTLPIIIQVIESIWGNFQ